MEIKVKILEGKKWREVSVLELTGKSIAWFVASSEKPVIAALFEENKAIAFVSNDEVELQKYENKGMCFMAKNIIQLLGSEVVPPLVTDSFPDATVVNVTNDVLI